MQNNWNRGNEIFKAFCVISDYFGPASSETLALMFNEKRAGDPAYALLSDLFYINYKKQKQKLDNKNKSK